MEPNITDIPLRGMDGKETSIRAFHGKVLLIVNVASKCGLTPQYAGLENLYERYREHGLIVLGFPANEFAGQEPGSNPEILNFCKTTYDVRFPMFEKIVVKGPGQHPLYRSLTQAIPKASKNPESVFEQNLQKHGLAKEKAGDIAWNFEKFIVNRAGSVVGRFAPDVDPLDPVLVDAIEQQLKENS